MAEHFERLTPTPVYWLLALLAGFFGAAAVYPVSTLLAAVTGLSAAAATAALLSRGAARVEVTEGELRVARAHVPLGLVSRVEVLDAAHARQALGPELDARAFVCTRPWVHTAVRVHLNDPADPTPYWVVATRRPGELAAALRSRRSSNGQAAHSEQTS